MSRQQHDDSSKQKVRSAFGLLRVWEDGSALPVLSRAGVGAQLCADALRAVIASPLTSVLTVITISISLFVFAGFLLFIENFRTFIATSQSDVSLSMYLREGTTKEGAQVLAEELRKLPQVREVIYRDKQEALQVFRQSLGPDAALLEGLEENNPLPSSLELSFTRAEGSENLFEQVADQYRSHVLVEQIHYSRGLLNRLGALLKAFRSIGAFAVCSMLLITGFIIANTIKLALYAHREEIEIMYLVGATDSFVRAPYMFEGFLQGLLGGIVSIVCLYLVYQSAAGFLSGVDLLSDILPRLQFLSFASIGLVLMVGISVGVVGSFLAVKRFMRS